MIRTEEFDKTDKERDDALEYYMRRCSELENENGKLKERIARLIWSMEEHD
jgi:prefoldin subunit 5